MSRTDICKDRVAEQPPGPCIYQKFDLLKYDLPASDTYMSKGRQYHIT